MPKSLWAILVIGFIGFVMLVLMMQFTVEKTVEATGIPLVIKSLQREYELDSVSISIENTGNGASPSSLNLNMDISYTTHKTSGFDISKQQEEMKSIGLRAMMLYNGADKKGIASIIVMRTEIVGSGCFRDTYTSNPLTLDNPSKRQ